MKILYITDFYYTVNSGARTSARAHLKTLQNLYGKEHVDVIALVGRNKPKCVEKGHTVIRGTENKIVLFCDCLCGYSTYLNRVGIRQIAEIAGKNGSDVVFVDNSIFGKLIKTMKKKNPRIPVVAYYHDVKASLAKTWRAAAPIYKKPVMQAMISNERLTAQYADANLVLGNREEKLFIDAYGKHPEAHLSVYMDINLTPAYFRRTIKNKKRLLFFGGYYLPNVHGIHWFIKNVFHEISDTAELIVAGYGMDQLEGQNYPAGVRIQGFVEELESVYRDADVIISPIFEGGGMKVKVAEAMAFGKVVVGSDESFEGYQEKIPQEYWDRYFYRANTAEEFTLQVKRALEFSEERLHFNKEIRELYEDGFSDKYAEKTISKIIDQVLREKIGS
ncbi:MAG: glycosyltransferase family 4 protein [Hungatella sp.]|nr:glycosyltransferase family 4 protein [Hungatella sp.]